MSLPSLQNILEHRVRPVSCVCSLHEYCFCDPRCGRSQSSRP